MENKMDVIRLHDVLEGELTGRCCGRTYAMLATSLVHADFDEPKVIIECENFHHAHYLIGFFIRVAKEMGFKMRSEIIQNREFEVKVNDTCYLFLLSKQKYNYLGVLDETPVYADSFPHHITENWDVKFN